MYNTDLPRRADLPSSAQLLRSTILAAVGAAVILVTVVLPSDYGVDPTGAGRLLGLTDMGETKVRLAAEAEADRLATEAANAANPGAGIQQVSNAELAERISSLERSVQELVRISTSQPRTEAGTLSPEDQIDAAAAAAASAAPVEESEPAPVAETAEQDVAALAPAEPDVKSDDVSVTLTPGQGIEIKLVMKKGAKANFTWSTEGGPVNFDTHGDGPGGQSISYEKGRGVAADEGTLTAGFDGNHGWFWRNRGKQDVRLTLRTAGYYSEMKGVPNQ